MLVSSAGVLAALNELRHCALPSLQQPLAADLHRALALAGGTLIRYHSMRSVSLSESQVSDRRGRQGVLRLVRR